MGRRWLALSIMLLLATAATAQRDPAYDRVVVPQTRVDLRDLGYAPIDIVPDGESGITSLTVAPNGDIYGATSGARSHLFVLDPMHGYVFPLGVIQDTQAVTNSLVVSAAGRVFVGSATSGHLLEYTPRNLDAETIQIGKPLATLDHGSPVAGETIAALAIDRKANAIYGLTMPNAHLFRYALAAQKFSDLGVVARTGPSGEKFEKSKIISRMLAVDFEGNVFASGEDGQLFEYSAATGELAALPIHAPAVPGREPFTRVDAFQVDAAGIIYGGTSDGYLFRLDPHQRSITNLGKPLSQYHVAGLAFGSSGKLFGVSGDVSDIARMFSYDPSTGAYEILGFVDVNRRPYYTWQAYVIGALVSDPRGTIYLGENERISKLYLFYP